MRGHLRLVEDDDTGGGPIRHAFPDGCDVVVPDKGGPMSDQDWEQLHEAVHKIMARRESE